MLPGKRDFYRYIHVNKEFWQQFQNYAPPSLRVIRTKFARIARTIYNIYIHDSQLNRPESVSLASLARQLLGEQREPHTGVFNRDFGMSVCMSVVS